MIWMRMSLVRSCRAQDIEKNLIAAWQQPRFETRIDLELLKANYGGF
jgi:hypothetical protein